MCLKTEDKLKEILSQRTMILDGATGTMIQSYGLSEEDFRGKEFSSFPTLLKGNNDILSLTCPKVISEIHRKYLEAGADIISTNTFNSQRISQAEYHTGDYVLKINKQAALIARAEADRMTEKTPKKPRFVAGSVGPTSKMASMSSNVDDAAYRAVTFDELLEAFKEQITSLIEGGVDILLIETIFDTLNCKAALEAARQSFEITGKTLPVMLSVTIADIAGHLLSGQTLEAFVCSTEYANVFSLGINCSFGAKQMLPFLRTLSKISPCYVSAHPNAGLPDVMGRYDETPESMALNIETFISEGLVNIVGGCCGTTPEHIKAIEGVVNSSKSFRKPHKGKNYFLSGTETLDYQGLFINVGERCNVAGSRKFLRLIKEEAWDEALSIARAQVRDGAQILDINMDDAMIDAKEKMRHFLFLLGSDPETARVPWMIDSSRFEVIFEALKTVQGKAIVNSISLKEGEEVFLERAKIIKRFGAAVVVMAFDEKGQATTYERKIEIAKRAYHLLIEKIGFLAKDIIFDPNVLSIATGIKEHDAYALDFIRATKWIKENLPEAKVSAGLSNLSFSFRGNDYIRQAMHSVFLYYAIKAGLDMAIMNPTASLTYEDIPKDLLGTLEDVILYKKEDASDRLIKMAQNYSLKKEERKENKEELKDLSLEERLILYLREGTTDNLEEDLLKALNLYPKPEDIISGPLMKGMSLVGELFSQGKMFLPQVVKTARTMRRSVEILSPYIKKENSSSNAPKRGKFLIATVKGDVHDIGKDIVSVVMACNNFEVIDLGVMVPKEKIVEVAIKEKVDIVALSGLITPSLDEMCEVAKALKSSGVSVPLMIGGATTSSLHTAIKIAPLYSGAVFRVKDASENPILATQLLGPERESVIACLLGEQERLREENEHKKNTSLTLKEAINKRHKTAWDDQKITAPTFKGIRTIPNISISEVREFINWRYFYRLWSVRSASQEAENIKKEAEKLLDKLLVHHHLKAQVGFFSSYGTCSSIVVQKESFIDGNKETIEVEIPTPRQERAGETGECLSLCDFVAPKGYNDYIGVFAITVSTSFTKELEELKIQGKEYEALLMQSLGDRLVEAASEYLHQKVRQALWGYEKETLHLKEIQKGLYKGIRPAVGYPSLPDQKTIFLLSKLIDYDKLGIKLTENGAMYPQSSISGIYIANPESRYFVL
ncbi:MAG: methionine synthase [Prevotella sp.]|nr:methionine synthase [Prevotella sp.]